MILISVPSSRRCVAPIKRIGVNSGMAKRMHGSILEHGVIPLVITERIDF